MTSEWIAIVSIRLCVLLYVWHLWDSWPRLPPNHAFVRKRNAGWIWTAAFICFFLHVVFSFDHYHDWQHVAALEHTAKQTEQVTGLNTGVGLYVNYLFLLVWSTDWAVLWFHRDPSHLDYPVRRFLPWFFAFMFFNATVVFGPPLWRAVFMVVAAMCATKRVRFEQ